MTICPKCGGTTIFDARDDAPTGVKDWVRCLCGKRWDPTKQAAPAVEPDVMATITRAFDEWQPEEEHERAARLDEDEEIERELPDSDDDLAVTDLKPAEEVESPTAMAMKDVRVKRERPKKEKTTMPKFVSEEHRQRWIEGRRRSRELKQEAAGQGPSRKPTPTKGHAQTRRGRPPKARQPEVSTVPAVVSTKPEALRDMTINLTLKPARGVALPGTVLSAIDAAIVSAHQDVAALERAREILSRGRA